VAARDRAEDAARQKNELVSMISHDVRAPLSAMTTALTLLDTTSPTPQQARYLRVLKSSCAHALELVNNLLDASRLEAGRTPLRESRFSLRQLADEATAPARAAAVQKPDVAVTVHVDDNVPDGLVGDKPKLQQVLTNLVTNAVKFTHRGFVSLIVTLREAADDRVTLEVTVTDTGIGIPADRLPHIFEEFTQATDDIAETYGGMGLGLTICRRLLHLHGSELHVTSTVGQGTTFSFPLTLKRAAAT
jgi:signal transduction histidine kinase